MLDEPFRRWFAQRCAAPARAMRYLGVSPNALTLTGVAGGLAAALLVAAGHSIAGIIVWLLSRVIDGYDGLVARLSGKASLFGGFLDITADMLAYSAMAVGFAYAAPAQWLHWLLVVTGYVMVTATTLALSSLLEHANRRQAGDRSLAFTRGLAEAGETSIVYVLLVVWPGASEAILIAWIALLGLTTLHRTLLAARLLR